MRVQAILGLVPDRGTAAVDHFVRYLLPAVSGKAVQYHHVIACELEK